HLSAFWRSQHTADCSRLLFEILPSGLPDPYSAEWYSPVFHATLLHSAQFLWTPALPCSYAFYPTSFSFYRKHSFASVMLLKDCCYQADPYFPSCPVLSPADPALYLQAVWVLQAHCFFYRYLLIHPERL